MSAPGPASRLPFVDAVKAIGSQLIVLHHLAFYGPMPAAAYELAPGLIDWLADYARIAVQAFLVAGGFLAARSLAPRGVLAPATRPPRAIVRRYLRLVLPLAGAIALALACAAIARRWMTDDAVPAPPGLLQALANVLLLHDLLDLEALSAGVWYVAIDFQLFATLVALLWLARGLGGGDASRAAGPGLALALAAASLLFFNRDESWDAWAPYFFGSYALGAFAWWSSGRGSKGLALAGLGLAVIALAALALDFRIRIAVALAVALALAAARAGGALERWPASRLLGWLAEISYSVFLVHFPILLVVNAAFSRFAGPDPSVNAAGLLVGWAASVAAGALFHRWVESRVRV